MRLATFNVENMFERAKILNLASWDDGRAVLNDFARLADLIEEPVYTAAIKDEILTIVKRHKGLSTQGESTYIRLRENRGRLLKKPKDTPLVVVE